MNTLEIISSPCEETYVLNIHNYEIKTSIVLHKCTSYFKRTSLFLTGSFISFLQQKGGRRTIIALGLTGSPCSSQCHSLAVTALRSLHCSTWTCSASHYLIGQKTNSSGKGPKLLWRRKWIKGKHIYFLHLCCLFLYFKEIQLWTGEKR
jgi:hypothetical protein